MGGAETWLVELLRYWHRNNSTGGPRFDFLATGGVPTYYDEEAKSYGANIFYLRYGRAYLASFVAGFRKILRDGRYAAIHDHGDYSAGWHFLVGSGSLPAVRVAHVHNPWGHIAVNYVDGPGRRFAVSAGKTLIERLATHVCGTSGEILRKYGFEPGRPGSPEVEVVHCGFNVDKFDRVRQSDRFHILEEFGWGQEAKLVLFAGRLDRALELADPTNHKNSWLALNVARSAMAWDPSVRLIVAGEGVSRHALQDRTWAWGLAEKDSSCRRPQRHSGSDERGGCSAVSVGAGRSGHGRGRGPGCGTASSDEHRCTAGGDCRPSTGEYPAVVRADRSLGRYTSANASAVADAGPEIPQLL